MMQWCDAVTTAAVFVSYLGGSSVPGGTAREGELQTHWHCRLPLIQSSNTLLGIPHTLPMTGEIMHIFICVIGVKILSYWLH